MNDRFKLEITLFFYAITMAIVFVYHIKIPFLSFIMGGFTVATSIVYRQKTIQ